jgi:hypothetical protein
MDIEEDPLGCTPPKATASSSIQTGLEAFHVFAAPETAPEPLDDFIYTDAPQLSLIITSLTT